MLNVSLAARSWAIIKRVNLSAESIEKAKFLLNYLVHVTLIMLSSLVYLRGAMIPGFLLSQLRRGGVSIAFALQKQLY